MVNDGLDSTDGASALDDRLGQYRSLLSLHRDLLHFNIFGHFFLRPYEMDFSLDSLTSLLDLPELILSGRYHLELSQDVLKAVLFGSRFRGRQVSELSFSE